MNPQYSPPENLVAAPSSIRKADTCGGCFKWDGEAEEPPGAGEGSSLTGVPGMQGFPLPPPKKTTSLPLFYRIYVALMSLHSPLG